ncbi:MAG TPA: winged helix-turn-helix domain-containing protein [Microlunatus sp.]|nr:winged helix-turn-helix domain-containing protein [Microlunatus sp.]
MGETTKRVEDTIRGWVDSGELAPGMRLPSERTLADELGAGRTTIRLVLTKLTSEGLIRAEHGRGYFVTEPE